MFVKNLLCLAAFVGLLSASPFSWYSALPLAETAQVSSAADSGASTSDKLLRLQQSQSEEEELILEEPTVPAPVVKKDSASAKLPSAKNARSVTKNLPAETAPTENVPGNPAQRAQNASGDSALLPLPESSTAEADDEIAGDDTASMAAKPMQDTIIPISVEKERSINFAENLRDYKSPRMAVLLSLLVPGLGQAWTGNRIRAASFITAEAAIIGLSAWQYSGANVKRKAAEKYLGEHYSLEQFDKYYNACIASFKKKFNTSDDNEAMILVNKNVFGAYDADTLRNVSDDLERMFNDRNNNTRFYELINNSGGGGVGNAYITGFTDIRPFNNPEAFTRFVDNWPTSLEKTPFDTTGTLNFYWHPTVLTNDTNAIYYKFDLENKDGTSIFENKTIYTVYGTSDFYSAFYLKDRAFEDQSKLAKSILFALVVNHVISAVDAGIMAKAHNDRLLNKESFWQRINLQGQFAFTPTGLTPQCTISLLF